MKRAFYYLRIERGYSRPHAADLLDISAGYLGRLERSGAPLSLPLALRMAALYGVTLNELTAPRHEDSSEG